MNQKNHRNSQEGNLPLFRPAFPLPANGTRRAVSLTLALVLAGMAPGLEFYSVLAANIAVTPGTGAVQTGPVGPAAGLSVPGNGTGLTQTALDVQAAGNLLGRSLSSSLPGTVQPQAPGNTPLNAVRVPVSDQRIPAKPESLAAVPVSPAAARGLASSHAPGTAVQPLPASMPALEIAPSDVRNAVSNDRQPALRNLIEEAPEVRTAAQWEASPSQSPEAVAVRSSDDFSRIAYGVARSLRPAVGTRSHAEGAYGVARSLRPAVGTRSHAEGANGVRTLRSDRALPVSASTLKGLSATPASVPETKWPSKPGQGKVDTSKGDFLPHELKIAQYLASEGHVVQALPEDSGENKRHADALVDDVKVEFKTLMGKKATYKKIVQVVTDSLKRGGQARVIFIDARGSGLQAGHASYAAQILESSFGSKLDSLRILGDGFDKAFGTWTGTSRQASQGNAAVRQVPVPKKMETVQGTSESLLSRLGRTIRDLGRSVLNGKQSKNEKTRLAQEARKRAIKQVLSYDGAEPGKEIQPFTFRDAKGTIAGKSRAAGLEGFLYTKREIERHHGREALLHQLARGDYFNYIDSLLMIDSGFKELRAELLKVLNEPGTPLEKDERLTRFIIRTVKDLQVELAGLDETLWVRGMKIYEILARSYNRMKPGRNFFDSIDDSELDRIVRDNPGTNTIWIDDIFQIGEARRWGTGGGSPYSLMRYAVKPELGGDEALKAFIKRAHAKGLKVMVDFVPNHTSLDSDLAKTTPEAFIHFVPPQELSNEDMLRLAPKEPGGPRHPAYYLVETDRYPENGKRVHKRILVHYPATDFGSMWIDMLQLDFSQPAARAWLNGQSSRLFAEFGVDAVRRDMAYYLLNGVFYPKWQSILSRELADVSPEMEAPLRSALAAFKERSKEMGGKEELKEMVEAIRLAKPSGIVMDEAYGFFTDLDRALSDSVYNKNDHDTSMGQYGLYDAMGARDTWKIREAVKNIAFRTWQKGGATAVEFVGNHDESNPVDKFGKYFRVAALTALMFRPAITYAGQERGVGQWEGLLGDLAGSVDRNKDTPFDIPVKIDWNARNAGHQEFLRTLGETALRYGDVLEGGTVDALDPAGDTPVVAWTVSRTEAGTGLQKALLLAANFSENRAGSFFKFQPLLPEFGAFLPKADRDYILKDRLNMGSDGKQAVYKRSGRELLEKGLYLELDGGQGHLFEIEEDAPTTAALPAANGISGIRENASKKSGLWRALGLPLGLGAVWGAAYLSLPTRLPVFWTKAAPYMAGAGFLIAAYALNGLARRGVDLLAKRLHWKPGTTMAARFATSILVYAVGGTLALHAAGISTGALLATFGVGGVAMTMAAKEFIGNFLEGSRILINRPFSIRDRIKIGPQEYEVKDMDQRYMSLARHEGGVTMMTYSQLSEKPVTVFREYQQRRPPGSEEPSLWTDMVGLARSLPRASLLKASLWTVLGVGLAAAPLLLPVLLPMNVLAAAPAWLPYLKAGLALLAAHFIEKGAVGFVRRLAEARDWSPQQAVVLKLLVQLAVYLVGGTVALHFLGMTWPALFKSLGATSIAMGWASSDILGNLIQGFWILATRPFTLGDRIEVGSVSGTVADMNMSFVVLVHEDGSHTLVPHSVLKASPFTVLAKGPDGQRPSPESSKQGEPQVPAASPSSK